MDEGRFDTMVRRWGADATRRRVLQVLGSGVIAGTLVPALLPDDAAANAKTRRCRRKHGVVTRTGTCRCASTYAATFHCHNEFCNCREAVDGSGFCSDGSSYSEGCETDANCATAGTRCVVLHGHPAPGVGDVCSASGECVLKNPQMACIGGTCELTNCVGPCSS
jgi:hypothetical protein